MDTTNILTQNQALAMLFEEERYYSQKLFKAAKGIFYIGEREIRGYDISAEVQARLMKTYADNVKLAHKRIDRLIQAN